MKDRSLFLGRGSPAAWHTQRIPNPRYRKATSSGLLSSVNRIGNSEGFLHRPEVTFFAH